MEKIDCVFCEGTAEEVAKNFYRCANCGNKFYVEQNSLLQPLRSSAVSLPQNGHVMQTTSKEARKGSKEDLNNQVLDFIRDYPDCTMKQASEFLRVPINTITWRFNDLRKDGLIFNSRTEKEMMWQVRA